MVHVIPILSEVHMGSCQVYASSCVHKGLVTNLRVAHTCPMLMQYHKKGKPEHEEQLRQESHRLALSTQQLQVKLQVR